jgi:uncharacterized OsmC-like protein
MRARRRPAITALEPELSAVTAGAGFRPAIQVTYLAGSKYRIAMGRHSLTIDQPADAGGSDAGPSPLQLFAASLVVCTAHYAGSYLTRHGLSADDLVVDGDFVTARDGPARVTSLSVSITAPANLPDNRRAGLLAVARHCTVHNTIRQPPTVDINLSQTSAAARLSAVNSRSDSSAGKPGGLVA